MYVCICNSIKEDRVRAAAATGQHETPEALMRTMCSGFNCGLCREEVEDIMEEETLCAANAGGGYTAPAWDTAHPIAAE